MSLSSTAQASASTSALGVIFSAFQGSLAPRKSAWRTKKDSVS